MKTRKRRPHIPKKKTYHNKTITNKQPHTHTQSKYVLNISLKDTSNIHKPRCVAAHILAHQQTNSKSFDDLFFILVSQTYFIEKISIRQQHGIWMHIHSRNLTEFVWNKDAEFNDRVVFIIMPVIPTDR